MQFLENAVVWGKLTISDVHWEEYVDRITDKHGGGGHEGRFALLAQSLKITVKSCERLVLAPEEMSPWQQKSPARTERERQVLKQHFKRGNKSGCTDHAGTMASHAKTMTHCVSKHAPDGRRRRAYKEEA